MLRALYTAASGMQTQGSEKFDVLAHNLSNVGTPGFRAQYIRQINLPDREFNSATDFQANTLDFFEDKRPGQLEYTGEKFDVDADGDTYFAVQDAAGGTAYTRNGRFKLRPDGGLVDRMGNRVMGQGGPITIPVRAANVVVDDKGQIFADGAQVAKFKVVEFDPEAKMMPVGGGLYQAKPGFPPKDSTEKVYQGYYERSNVNSVEEMVRMMTTVRSVESYSKMLLAASDDTTAPLIRQTGKIG